MARLEINITQKRRQAGLTAEPMFVSGVPYVFVRCGYFFTYTTHNLLGCVYSPIDCDIICFFCRNGKYMYLEEDIKHRYYVPCARKKMHIEI